MSDYQPIPCADHERLEFAALTKQWLEVAVDCGMAQRLLPLDVYTRNGAEWLKAQTGAGDMVTLRLDTLTF
ncbi:transcriptional antiterminator, Rof [Thiobacillus sp.]